MRKLLLSLSVFATSLIASPAIADASTISAEDQRKIMRVGVSSTAIARLCYVKAEDAPVAYNSESSRYGVSRHQRAKLEALPVCNGTKLGDVQSNWRLRKVS